ncbi:hypothetical protein GCM10009663_69240 [Kitasatospora arboriphila]|uniref:Uncharacterized protein n=1 Tax=Kitasatospora arboriphila TaxID=258052 RepID=A0ABN1U6E1_9ACTN
MLPPVRRGPARAGPVVRKHTSIPAPEGLSTRAAAYVHGYVPTERNTQSPGMRNSVPDTNLQYVQPF